MSRPNSRHIRPTAPPLMPRAERDALLSKAMLEVAATFGIAPDRAKVLIAEGQARGNAIADQLERQRERETPKGEVSE